MFVYVPCDNLATCPGGVPRLFPSVNWDRLMDGWMMDSALNVSLFVLFFWYSHYNHLVILSHLSYVHPHKKNKSKFLPKRRLSA